jgi:hypothetical protein
LPAKELLPAVIANRTVRWEVFLFLLSI